MYNTPKKIEYEIEDISKDRERPAKSNQLPNIGISMIIEPILIKAAKPTLVDPITCNFAENIEEIVRGIIVKPNICKLNIPSEYWEKNWFTNIGDKKKMQIEITTDKIKR